MTAEPARVEAAAGERVGPRRLDHGRRAAVAAAGLGERQERARRELDVVVQQSAWVVAVSANARARPAFAPPAKPRFSRRATTPGKVRPHRLVVDEDDVAARLARPEAVDGRPARAPAPPHHDGARPRHRTRVPAASTTCPMIRSVSDRKLDVGLDLLFLVPGETGGRETYAVELIRALARARRRPDATAFVNRELVEARDFELDPRVALRGAPRAAGGAAPGRSANRCSSCDGRAPAGRPGARFANFGPLYGPFGRVLSLHDLMFLRVPELLPLTNRLGARALAGGAAHRAHRVLASSQATRDDAVELLGLDPARIDVVPNGLGTAPIAALDPHAAARSSASTDERTCWRPDSRSPTRTSARLIAAVARIPAERRPQLVLTAGGDRGELATEATLDAAGDVRVRRLASPELLEGAYAGAACVAFPSLVEGFGLPILEAMMRDVPIACSDIPSLREVAGDARCSSTRWTRTRSPARSSGCLNDQPARERLRAAGRARAARFTWRATAEGTLRCYERTLGSRPER